MKTDKIEDIASTVESILYHRVERLIRYLKMMQKENSLEVLGIEVEQELNQLKFELQTLLNYMEMMK